MSKIFNKGILLALCFGIASLTSCATIAKGPTQVISINSNVTGAAIMLDGNRIGVTPFTGSIKKGHDKIITVSADGYIPQTILLTTEVDFIFVVGGNFITGGTTGTTTDVATGAAWEYKPSTYFVQLQQEGRQSRQSKLDFDNELAIRYFATINHSQIAIDAGGNGGEYMDALADLMKSKMNNKTAIESIKNALYKSKCDQLVFADELIDQFQFRN